MKTKCCTIKTRTIETKDSDQKKKRKRNKKTKKEKKPQQEEQKKALRTPPRIQMLVWWIKKWCEVEGKWRVINGWRYT